jgi:hypothetical protein
MASWDPGDREERAANNQTLFREINERVKSLNDTAGLNSPTDWVCECANTTCVERIEMSAYEYEAVREDGTRFLVAATDDHVWLDVERVTKCTGRYWVVEKTGRAGRLAESANPRSGDRL